MLKVNKMEKEILYKFRNKNGKELNAYRTVENLIIAWYTDDDKLKMEMSIKEFNKMLNNRLEGFKHTN